MRPTPGTCLIAAAVGRARTDTERTADPEPGAGRPAEPPAGPRARGQILILCAIVLPVLLGMAAVGVDVAYLYANRRDLQGAADLAALAGAVSLPNDAGGATASALNFASQNGWTDGADGVSVDVATPYNGDASKIEVAVRYPAPTFFARIFGVATIDVGARAVAERIKGFGGIFAMKNTCGGDPGIEWSGSSATVTGSVHSNSEIKVGGSNNTVNGSTTYACPDNGGYELKEDDNTYNPAPAETTNKPPPLSFSASDFPCTPGLGTPATSKLELKNFYQSGKTLRTGVYCAQEIILSDSDVTGEVTLVAFGSGGKIKISGQHNTLTPHVKGVLAYSQGTSADALKVEGSDNSWSGILYAPVGRVDMSGSDGSTLTGGILGWTVKLPGSVWGVAVGEDGSGKVHLVE